MYLENTMLYGDRGEVPADDYLVPLGVADIKREGTDLTIVSYGRAAIQSLAAAHLLQQEHNISVEVVDLRSIRPLDMDTVLASVRKTHRVLVVEEQKPFCGVGAQLAFMIQSEAFDDLDGPIARLTTVDAPAIYSPAVEVEQLPNMQRIVKAAKDAVA
jgi:pyruvate dehydrogenase E1 component beta subunit